ncbi:hypothetical protein CDD83_6890 [Cordyceps sp. RAO-2017]|nr:hypothetical protein CDD83_6890 [Cordyceps sp. RAO-2017]
MPETKTGHSATREDDDGIAKPSNMGPAATVATASAKRSPIAKSTKGRQDHIKAGEESRVGVEIEASQVTPLVRAKRSHTTSYANMGGRRRHDQRPGPCSMAAGPSSAEHGSPRRRRHARPIR